MACFLIAMLAGLGFIAAYLIFQVHSLTNVQHSNLALGSTMGLAFLALAVGAVIWVRRLMPRVELTEARKPLRSSEEDRAAFAETFDEGAEASQFVKRPMVRRTLIAATVPVAVAPIVLLRDLGPLPGTKLDHTVWRKGMRLLNYGANTPIRPADFASPGGMITVVPDGFQDDFNALAKAAVIIIKFAPDSRALQRQAWCQARSCRTGRLITSWRTRKSARTSAARQPCTSRPRTTYCARVTSRPLTRPGARR